MTALRDVSDGQLKALAVYVAAVRDTWDRPGILAALHACRRSGRTLEQLEHVALTAARDRTARTPATIGHQSRWDALRLAKPAEAPRPAADICARCHRIRVTGVEHRCQGRTPPPPEALAAARRAVAEAKPPRRLDQPEQSA